MNFYICLHNTYHSVEVVLHDNSSCLAGITITKESVSANLIYEIDNLLKSNQIDIADITCLIVNKGPAPFTTLRSIIATSNGISFGAKIPLVGVDGLTTLVQEYASRDNTPTIALLNAFNKAVYYAVRIDTNKKAIIGCDSIITVLTSLKNQLSDTKFQFIGNGTSLYKKEIQEIFADQALIPEPIAQTASVEAIFKQGLKQWIQKEDICMQLEPLYLKKPMT